MKQRVIKIKDARNCCMDTDCPDYYFIAMCWAFAIDSNFIITDLFI